MPTAQSADLLARQVFTKTLIRLAKILNACLLTLPRRAFSIIADDSDDHRIRRGYTGYHTSFLATIQDRPWLIAMGLARGGYPADPYNCDLIALPIDDKPGNSKELAELVTRSLEKNGFYTRSLICANDIGHLFCTPESALGLKVFAAIKDKVHEFITAAPEVRPGLYHGDLRPVYSSDTHYKPEVVDFLTEKILGVLNDAS